MSLSRMCFHLFVALALAGTATINAGALELANVAAGKRGYVVESTGPGDQVGMDVAGAGDVNGDGLNDFIITKFNLTLEAGEAYVVFGRTDRSRLNLSEIVDGNGGFAIHGTYAPASVSGAGDVNGDGLDDVVVGVPRDILAPTDPPGTAYVIFGKSTTTPVETSDIEEGVGGFAIHAEAAGDYTGARVSNAGDVNGDGLDDVIIGAPGWETPGSCFVVLGKTNTDPTALDDIAVGNGGFVVRGPAEGYGFGSEIAAAGDVNGDGLDDIFVNGVQRFSHVVFGKTHMTPVNADDIIAGSPYGFYIRVNGSLAGAGDVNADGLADLLIGAQGLFGTQASEAGGAYVVFGKTTTTPVTPGAAGTGFTILGDSRKGWAGSAVAGIGDTNHDGYDDVLITAPGEDAFSNVDIFPHASGRAYVIFGKATSNLVPLSDVRSGIGGYPVNGIATVELSLSIMNIDSVGDTNGDGWSDFIIGMPGFSSVGHGRTGACFVVLGGPLSFPDSDGDGLSDPAETDTGLFANVWDTGTDPLQADSDRDGVNDSMEVTQWIDPNNPFVKPANSAPWHMVDLANVVLGSGGRVINARTPNDGTGFTVSGAGDVNGDGTPDAVIGASDSYVGTRYHAGRSFVIFGSRGNAPINLSLPASRQGGFTIDGSEAGDLSGIGVSGAGDVNGDGFDDVIIGARGLPYLNTNSYGGKCYVVFGKATTTRVRLQDVEAGVGGFLITRELPDRFIGDHVAGAGDVNGDGLADILIGAVSNSYNDRAYVIFGKSTTAHVRLTDVESGVGGFVIDGDDALYAFAWNIFGDAPRNTDVNGDGLADIVLSSGDGYVVFGKTDTTPVLLSDLPGTGLGFLVDGSPTDANTSLAPATIVGDINGDGLADLVFGAYDMDQDLAPEAGGAYVVFGKTNGDTVSLNALAQSDAGFVIHGETGTYQSCRYVSSAGDVNRDGLGDILVSGEGRYGAQVARTYLVYGKADTTPVHLSAARAGTGGFFMNGVFKDRSGLSLAQIGDFNQDGYDDFILGAIGASRAYIVFGFAPPIPDTDQDLIPDHMETGTGIYNGPTDTGTDPNNPDSDGDGMMDGIENDLGTDPNDPLEFPDGLALRGALWLQAILGALAALTIAGRPRRKRGRVVHAD